MTNPNEIIVRSIEDAKQLELTYPVQVRPLFSVDGCLFDPADNQDMLIHLVAIALDASATGEVLITPDNMKLDASTNLGPREPNDDMVICPNCTCQFRAIPVNIQKELLRLQKSIDNCSTEEGLCYAVELERKNKEIERLWSLIFHD